ncbi:RedY protein [Nocardia terpenica]|uniref:RedY protein n=1 Tax=Nocardia terpenica TaxID=455432 RepID=A0A291RPR3_9NOCA|nr:RedY protein [Nocardia terpenica]ATL69259.1 RedY protein [Nocardia terpenica]
METIVHLIRLHPHTDPRAFESWVREVDYATCPRLPSVRAFAVQRAPAADGSWHYFEVIQVTSRAEFERDMRTPAFAELETTFETMASVVQEFAGVRVGSGYLAP